MIASFCNYALVGHSIELVAPKHMMWSTPACWVTQGYPTRWTVRAYDPSRAFCESRLESFPLLQQTPWAEADEWSGLLENDMKFIANAFEKDVFVQLRTTDERVDEGMGLFREGRYEFVQQKIHDLLYQCRDPGPELLDDDPFWVTPAKIRPLIFREPLERRKKRRSIPKAMLERMVYSTGGHSFRIEFDVWPLLRFWINRIILHELRDKK